MGGRLTSNYLLRRAQIWLRLIPCKNLKIIDIKSKEAKNIQCYGIEQNLLR